MVLVTASVFKWAVVCWTLAQVIICCGALEDAVHIRLHLDGKEKDLVQMKYLVQMWYDKNTNTVMYNDPSQRQHVEKVGLKKLYIRGTFEKVGEGENISLLWDNKRKDVKALGEFISNMFKPDDDVIVVFPDVQSYAGYLFQKEFEEVVQAKNKRITVGRAVINVYLGLGDQNQKKQVDTLLQSAIETQTIGRKPIHEQDEKYYSIFAEYNLNRFSFRTVFTSWSSDLPPLNIYQVMIQEADSVVVKLLSICTSDQNGLKVGAHTEQDLLTILLKLLHVDGVKTHPKQRIRVELPADCGTPNEREKFTGELVDNLQKKTKYLKGVDEIKVFGKDPHVHIHMYYDMTSDMNYMQKVHPEDTYIDLNKSIVSQVKNHKSLSSAKELFIHIHCHGIGKGNDYKICSKDPNSLANSLINVVKTWQNSEPQTAVIMFHVCNAGTDYGQKYVNTFLTECDKLLQEHKITIQESWSYKYEVDQIFHHAVVTLPNAENCGLQNLNNWPYVNEKDIFGSFTVRTIKTTQGYEAFSVLPLSKYDLIYKK